MIAKDWSPRNDCQVLQDGRATAATAVQSLGSPHCFSPSPMDLRLVLVAAPIVLAAGWAVFHIGRAAVGQLQLMIARARA